MITRGRFGGFVGGVGAVAIAASASVASAHVCLDAPIPRACDGAQQKQGPCGSRTGRAPSKVTTFRPGETITVRINERINHPSHYRIAFNPNGDTFEDPTSREDNQGKHPHVLLDNIQDESAAQQSVKVTLPNITCNNCTLQLIQVMYDKGGNGFAGNDGVGARGDDLYYACADIVLAGDPVGGAAQVDAGSDTPSTPDAGAPVTVNAAGVDSGPLALVGDSVSGDAPEADSEPAAEAGGCSVPSQGAGAAGAAYTLFGLAALVARGRRRH